MKLECRVAVIVLCLAVLATAGAFAAETPQPESPASAPAVSEPAPHQMPSLDLAGPAPEPIFLVWPPPTGCPPPPAYPCRTYTDCTGYCGGIGSCYKTGGSNCGKCLCA